MKLKFVALTILAAMTLSFADAASLSQKEKKKRKKKGKTEMVAPKPAPVDPKVKAYDDIVKNSTVSRGVFNTYINKEGKLFFELTPEAVNGQIFLLSNRVAKTSDTANQVAGQMINDPFMIRFEVKGEQVYLYLVQNSSECREGDSMQPAFEKNFADPILKVFKQVASKGNQRIIDITEFFGTPEKVINPITPGGGAPGSKKSVGNRFNSKNSKIESARAFPENIEIKSLMTFDSDNGIPYTITLHRSLIRLPKEAMKMRLQNKKFGYFSSGRNLFTTETDKMERYEFIHRWRLEPKPEDMEKYIAGELVEPQKQIVYHVDTAFPEKWRSAIIQGINDWNIAFAKAGFKNAIVGKPYPSPKEDPSFDPDDMRYSCFKYAATATPNAMGPSYTDPRSGEILTGDVIWYHNVISLVHNWRFVQTAAVDKRVREKVFPDDLMWECLRYVAAHEIGHTLGLMHNMGASSKYPVDSLRSASFTQKYGTTPSIMDYTRNNYVAQPGDLEKGVRMTPPVMGVFDELTIKWGYQYLPDTKPEEEKSILNKMVEEYEIYPKYAFGAQQWPGTVDVRDQMEDLGDDHFKANEYGYKNLRLIMKNLEDWVGEKGEDYSTIITNYREIVSQYSRMMNHILAYIGGAELNESLQGENLPKRTYVSKAQNNKAMKWLFNETRTNGWLTPSYITTKYGLLPSANDNLNLSVVGGMLNPSALNRIYEAEIIGQKNAYKLNDYISDFTSMLMSPTTSGKKLTRNDIAMQNAAVNMMISYSNLQPAPAAAAPQRRFTEAEIAYNTLQEDIRNSAVLSPLYDVREETSFSRSTMGEKQISQVVLSPLMTSTLKRILNIYTNAASSTSDKTSRDFYQYQVIKIKNVLENR